MGNTVQVMSECDKRGHEQVVFFNYPEVGLKAIVGIHSTVLGPALGGCRMRVYQNESEALDDVMRLSEGMTYKNAVAGLDSGGGKSCIIADPNLDAGREQLFKQFAKCLGNLNGRYITAEDMGTSVRDVMWMRAVAAQAVAGIDPAEGGGGDPSPWTAFGVFLAIKAACKLKYDSENLEGKRVSVQGAGHVGRYLVEHLRKVGAVVTVCDPCAERVQACVQDFGAQASDTDKIYDQACDIYAPCAIGQTVNVDTLKRLSCDIIAGAANNQLSDPEIYSAIEQHKIMYCPDFVINAGGVISVAGELQPGGWKEQWVSGKVNDIYNTTSKVMQRAMAANKFPELVAIELANERIDQARAKQQK